MYRAAIIGCGNIAGGYDVKVPVGWSTTHAGAYHLSPDTQLIAVSDTNASALKVFQKKWDVENGYLDYHIMLENEAIDILSLCLPTEQHFSAFKAAIDQDIAAIFCEKPLSEDLEEAKKIVEMSHGRVVSVNYFRRWNPTLFKISVDIKKGKFGRCFHIIVRYTKGIILNGSHFIDLMRWFLGEPENISYIRTVQHDSVDPGVDFLFTYKDNLTVFFINIADLDYVFADIDILMEKGRIVIGQRGQRLYQYPRIRDPYYQLFDIIGDQLEIETQWRNCTTRSVAEIVNCLKNGGTISCTVQDGYRALEICHHILDLKKQQKSNIK